MTKIHFQSFPHIRVVRPSYAYHCCQFMPSTYENLVIIIVIIIVILIITIIIIFIILFIIFIIIIIFKVPEYADFGDLREDIFFPGEFDLSQFGNQTMPSVIWSTSGRDHECGDDFYLAADDDSYSDEDSDKNMRTKEFTSI